MVYANRSDASQVLIDKLGNKEIDVDVVVAIPKDGIFLGEKLAEYFDVPLQVIAVGALKLDNYPKFELGAVADDGTLWVEDNAVKGLDIPGEIIENSRLKSLNHAQQELREYLGQDSRDFKGKNVLLVDDGACRSSYLMAAIGLLKKNNANSINVALPVAARNVVLDINSIADTSLIVEQPRFLSSVEAYFESLEPVHEDEVKNLVKEN